jgi:hypothetical protein
MRLLFLALALTSCTTIPDGPWEPLGGGYEEPIAPVFMAPPLTPPVQLPRYYSGMAITVGKPPVFYSGYQ